MIIPEWDVCSALRGRDITEGTEECKGWKTERRAMKRYSHCKHISRQRQLSAQDWGCQLPIMDWAGTQRALPLLAELLVTDRFWARDVTIFSCVGINEPTTREWIVPSHWSDRWS